MNNQLPAWLQLLLPFAKECRANLWSEEDIPEIAITFTANQLGVLCDGNLEVNVFIQPDNLIYRIGLWHPADGVDLGESKDMNLNSFAEFGATLRALVERMESKKSGI